ncbi:hypothetical protein SPI_05749 [Niveomyces insectorum RCEF 264]|uniref:NYN domain-containing protein n=1 Tax=Niveomyces insectorum RCEF 264 TaxID=1081102 RepID=A0A167SEK1_9HYPO|nr:hypothetical protein SPI_05749 [Niveomyces insectorum RCEF 264]
MSRTTTATALAVDAAALLGNDRLGRYPSLPPPPPPPPRAATPKLGDFNAVFSVCFEPPAAADFATPGGSSTSTNQSLDSAKHALSTRTEPSPAQPIGFLSGLDLSVIDSPSTTPVSLLHDVATENEADEDDDENDDDDDRNATGRTERKLGTSSLGPHDAVVIASASSSPSAAAAAARAAVAATVATSNTPTIPKSGYLGSSPPKRSTAGATPFRNTLPLLPGSTVAPRLTPLPGLWLPGSTSSPAVADGNNPVQPLVWRAKHEALERLEAKLQPEYKRDRVVQGRLTDPDTDPDKDPSTAGAGGGDAPLVHVFVDLSNIVIGFYDRIRTKRHIAPDKKMRAPPFFFEGLACILERGRPAARRVVAGSAPDSGYRPSWPAYMLDAEALGYEMNILSRVTRSVPSPTLRPQQQQQRWANGYPPTPTPKGRHTSPRGHRKQASRGYNNNNTDGLWSSDALSSDEAPPPPLPLLTRSGEQAVDEILHLKMCHSVLDYAPGTLVLATGDAAAAEFSDGFLKHVERALDRGWCVEVLAWKLGISYAWRELERRQRDAADRSSNGIGNGNGNNSRNTGQFRIIELDRYVEELLAGFVDS